MGAGGRRFESYRPDHQIQALMAFAVSAFFRFKYKLSTVDVRLSIVLLVFPGEESEDSVLLFSNMGSFIPGTIENVIRSDAPESRYRNSFLAHAMVNLNMIDTIGSGIKRMFTIQ